jgi:hypothetical protein
VNGYRIIRKTAADAFDFVIAESIPSAYPDPGALTPGLPDYYYLIQGK